MFFLINRIEKKGKLVDMDCFSWDKGGIHIQSYAKVCSVEIILWKINVLLNILLTRGSFLRPISHD